MNYRMMCVVMLSGAPAWRPAGADAQDPPAKRPQGDQGVTGDNGADGQDLAAPEAAIASVAPNALLVGRTTTLRIVGTSPNGQRPPRSAWTPTTRRRRCRDRDGAGQRRRLGRERHRRGLGSARRPQAARLHRRDRGLHAEGASVTVTAAATSSQSNFHGRDLRHPARDRRVCRARPSASKTAPACATPRSVATASSSSASPAYPATAG